MSEDVAEALGRSCAKLLAGLKSPPLSMRAKEAAKRLLGRGNAMSDDLLFWPAGFLLMGLAARSLLKGHDSPEERAVAGYFGEWRKRGPVAKNVDDGLAGAAALMMTGRGEVYRLAADRVRDFFMGAKADVRGSFIYHPSKKNAYVFADGAGMAAFFLSRWDGGDGAAMQEMARRQLSNYLKYGFDKLLGLPYHGYLQDRGEKMGLVGWGRAVGFILMGLSSIAEKVGDPELDEAYRALVANVLRYQRDDGGFSWLLPAREGHLDTSATAMIGIGLARAMKDKDDRVLEAVCGIRSVLVSHIEGGELGSSLAECRDFGEHPQRFGVYPWGMGAALYFLSFYDGGLVR